MAQKNNGHDHERTLAKIIAMTVRNHIEDLHEHITDELMMKLNQHTRDAVFTTLVAMKEYPKSEAARQFIGFQSMLIPKYWEDPELTDEYIRTRKMFAKKPAKKKPTKKKRS